MFARVGARARAREICAAEPPSLPPSRQVTPQPAPSEPPTNCRTAAKPRRPAAFPPEPPRKARRGGDLEALDVDLVGALGEVDGRALLQRAVQALVVHQQRAVDEEPRPVVGRDAQVVAPRARDLDVAVDGPRVVGVGHRRHHRAEPRQVPQVHAGHGPLAHVVEPVEPGVGVGERRDRRQAHLGPEHAHGEGRARERRDGVARLVVAAGLGGRHGRGAAAQEDGLARRVRARVAHLHPDAAARLQRPRDQPKDGGLTRNGRKGPGSLAQPRSKTRTLTAA